MQKKAILKEKGDIDSLDNHDLNKNVIAIKNKYLLPIYNQIKIVIKNISFDKTNEL